MSLTLRKIGKLCAFSAWFLAAILCVSHIVGVGKAEELSDFEKLLQEAIQSNRQEKPDKAAQSATALPSKSGGSPGKLMPGQLVPDRKSVPQTPQPIGATSKVASKAVSLERTAKPKGERISGGWTTVTPHPATMDAVKIADKAMPDQARADKAIWDAEPITVKPGSVQTEPVVKPSEIPPPLSMQDQSELDTEIPNKEPLKETPLTRFGTAETEVVEAAVPEEPVKLDTVVNVGKSGVPAQKGPNLDAPETKKSVVDSRFPGEMASILDSLAQDGAEAHVESGVENRAGRQNEQAEATRDREAKSAEQADRTPDKQPAKTEPAKDSAVADANRDSNATTKPIESTPKTEASKAETLKTEEAKKSETLAVVVERKPEPTFPAFDADGDEAKWQLIDATRVGDPHAADKLRLMYDEIVNGLRTRNMSGRYEMWKNYAKATLRNTAGLNTGSELDGRCRLNWYKSLYADPIKSVHEASEFSRKIHHGLSGSHRHLAETLTLIREKMDVPARNDGGVRFVECKTPIDAVNEVKRCLLEAQMGHARAVSTLSPAELSELERLLVPTFVGPGCVEGHTIPNRSVGRRLTNMMEKIDKAAMYDAAEALLPLTNASLLALLDKLPEDAVASTMIHGQKVQRISTAAGDIIIGGREANTYDLDAQDMRDVVCVIDLGGNDTYRDGTCNLRRPVLAIIDLKGNDTYVGTKPGIQGGSVLGVSLLVDAEGNDTYSAGDLCQGSTIGGAGMLFDFAGNDSYKALRRTQGHALCGVGVLVDRKGTDKYRAALWAQGFGAPGGFGALEDVEGNDHYFCGGIYLDSYPEHPGYDGWGQGIGAGIRQVANGGIGMILDGAGNDVYEVDYFGHGGGYWLGVGIAQDFGGDDFRYGTTRSMYNGGPRQQQEWTRFANGFGCHYALGYVFDDAGDDTYGGRIMGTGMAWDLSIGFLCDFNGKDRFTATGGMTQGVGAEGSIGILYTYGGDDTFMGRNQAYASNNLTYHTPANCGSNFSFLVNYGGNDKYGSGARNNSYVQRGSQGGFLIDRPTDREAASELAKMKDLIEQREKEIAEYDEMVKKGREEAAARGRSYRPRTRRPAPISADSLQKLGSVPYFESATRTTMK